MTEMDVIILALNNHRSGSVISHQDKTKIFIFYIKNIRKQGLSVDKYYPFLKDDIKKVCRDTEVSDSEQTNVLRKVKEYLLQEEKRVKRLKNHSKY